MSYRYLIFGKSRNEIARALHEYRHLIRTNPTDELTPLLTETSQKIRQALAEQRRIDRAL